MSKTYSHTQTCMNMQPAATESSTTVPTKPIATRPEKATPSASEAWSVHGDGANVNHAARCKHDAERAATRPPVATESSTTVRNKCSATRPEIATPSASEAWSVHDDGENMNRAARRTQPAEPVATRSAGAA